ncbi:MAG TPA: DUF488 family protein [Terriglobales bacterium]|nr:DUF488 family protein [Terriglobales bacterium]
MPVVVKRVYEKAVRSDGTRVLVDRLWPRGLRKEAAAIDAWLKPLAPSDGLRKWFHANPEQRATFRKRYLQELEGSEAAQALEQLYDLAHDRKKLTLLFASKNTEFNNATVLKELLEGMRKPPSSTTRAAAASGRARARARR